MIGYEIFNKLQKQLDLNEDFELNIGNWYTENISRVFKNYNYTENYINKIYTRNNSLVEFTIGDEKYTEHSYKFIGQNLEYESDYCFNYKTGFKINYVPSYLKINGKQFKLKLYEGVSSGKSFIIYLLYKNIIYNGRQLISKLLIKNLTNDQLIRTIKFSDSINPNTGHQYIINETVYLNDYKQYYTIEYQQKYEKLDLDHCIKVLLYNDNANVTSIYSTNKLGDIKIISSAISNEIEELIISNEPVEGSYKDFVFSKCCRTKVNMLKKFGDYVYIINTNNISIDSHISNNNYKPLNDNISIDSHNSNNSYIDYVQLIYKNSDNKFRIYLYNNEYRLWVRDDIYYKPYLESDFLHEREITEPEFNNNFISYGINHKIKYTNVENISGYNKNNENENEVYKFDYNHCNTNLLNGGPFNFFRYKLDYYKKETISDFDFKKHLDKLKEYNKTLNTPIIKYKKNHFTMCDVYIIEDFVKNYYNIDIDEPFKNIMYDDLKRISKENLINTPHRPRDIEVIEYFRSKLTKEDINIDEIVRISNNSGKEIIFSNNED